MTTQLVARNKINTVDDMLYGAGLGVSIGSVSVNGAETGTHYNKKDRTKKSFMMANVQITLDFEAGYSLSGSYDCRTHGSVGEDLTTDLESNPLLLLINYSDSDDMPFNNWYVNVKDDKELLQEILTAGNDSYGESNDEGYLGENFSYTYHDANIEVAYGLQQLFTLSSMQFTKLPEPYGTEFTSQIESKIKAAILSYFKSFE